MDDYAPDFMSHWIPAHDAADDRDERRTAGDEEALAELAERILAARSVV
ncbi:hypothetical protein BURK1_01068 [Burkholderiales bacterium]|nr:hypothetical protein BURK1_01068 [Burkholderiales bacterium]